MVVLQRVSTGSSPVPAGSVWGSPPGVMASMTAGISAMSHQTAAIVSHLSYN